MLNIEQARRINDGEPDIVELLREYELVERYYREAVAAMAMPEAELAPVLNSAETLVSFQPAFVSLDLSRSDR